METNCIKAGSWVEITKIIATKTKAPSNEENSSYPYQIKVRGYLAHEVTDHTAPVKIETPSGRIETGLITASPPLYDLPMGEASQELASIGRENRLILHVQQRQRLQ